MLAEHNTPQGPGQTPGPTRDKPLPCRFPGLVVIARAKHPIPSRTRPLSAVAPMVLRLKTWESRSPPNLISDNPPSTRCQTIVPQPKQDTPVPNQEHRFPTAGTPVAGWSSPVARQAHNLKVTGSNPVPATKFYSLIKDFKAEQNARLLSFQILVNAWSTFCESPLRGPDNRVTACQDQSGRSSRNRSI